MAHSISIPGPQECHSLWGLRRIFRGFADRLTVIITKHIAVEIRPRRVRLEALSRPRHHITWRCRPSKTFCSFESPGAAAARVKCGVPDEIQTRVLTLRGWCPGSARRRGQIVYYLRHFRVASCSWRSGRDSNPRSPA